jgi:hypothetical protein
MGWRDNSTLRALRLLRRDPARLPPQVQAIPDPAARFAAAMLHHGTSEPMLATLLQAARWQATGFAVLALGAALLHVWPLVVALLLLAADRARMATELRDRRYYGPLAWLGAAISQRAK